MRWTVSRLKRSNAPAPFQPRAINQQRHLRIIGGIQNLRRAVAEVGPVDGGDPFGLLQFLAKEVGDGGFVIA